MAGEVTSSLNGAALCGGPVEVDEGSASSSSSLSPQGDGGIGASTAFGKALLLSAPEPEAKVSAWSCEAPAGARHGRSRASSRHPGGQR